MMLAFILIGAVAGAISGPTDRLSLESVPRLGRVLLGAVLAFFVWKLFIAPDPPNPNAGDPYTAAAAIAPRWIASTCPSAAGS